MRDLVAVFELEDVRHVVLVARSYGGMVVAMLQRARERSASDSRFHYRVLRTSHNAMITDPAAVTALLIEAATLH